MQSSVAMNPIFETKSENKFEGARTKLCYAHVAQGRKEKHTEFYSMCRFCVNGIPGQDFEMFGGRDSMFVQKAFPLNL